MKPAAANAGRPLLWSGLGIAALGIAWQLTAMRLGPLLMATPLQTADALLVLVSSDAFQRHALLSLLRVLCGVGLGIAIGLGLGLLAGAWPRLRALLEPLRWLLMSVPGVIVVVLAMLWLGMGTTMVVFIGVVLLAPGVYVNTLKGLLLVDPALQEMATVYRFSSWQRLRHVVLPALTAPLCAALLVATSGGVRLVVMAEVLGAADGAGYALANARSTFDAGELYAWVVLVLGLVALIELGLLRPLQRRLTRWQRADAAPARIQEATMLLLDGIVLDRGPRRVLDGVDLALAAGERVGVVGPSGAGKSSLLKLVAGLLQPTRGRVQSRFRHAVLMFQEPRLLPWRSVRDNLIIPLRAAGHARQQAEARAASWLERVGLDADAHAWPGQLSGGMQQRAALARAFALEPDLLLLDEPFAALDPALRQTLGALCDAELARTGAALLCVSHHPEELSERVARCIHLDAGRIRPHTLPEARTSTSPESPASLPPDAGAVR